MIFYFCRFLFKNLLLQFKYERNIRWIKIQGYFIKIMLVLFKIIKVIKDKESLRKFRGICGDIMIKCSIFDRIIEQNKDFWGKVVKFK